MKSREPYVGRPLVYLAAPYTKPDPIENTHRAIATASVLIEEGVVTPVVPHLTLVWHLLEPRDVKFWYEYDIAILARCDALLRLPGESQGADVESEEATRRAIPVFVDRDELYAWARKWRVEGVPYLQRRPIDG